MNLRLRSKLERIARQYGASLDISEIERRELTLNVDLPAGRVWTDNGLHTLAGGGDVTMAEWAKVYVNDLIERIEGGTRACDDPNCETCLPEEAKMTQPAPYSDVTFTRVERSFPLCEQYEETATGPTGATLSICDCSNHGEDCYLVFAGQAELAEIRGLEAARDFCRSHLSHRPAGIPTQTDEGGAK